MKKKLTAMPTDRVGISIDVIWALKCL